ncbi:MAG: hypothetical protein WC749_02120 [Dehalococcoidia bacterium]
MLKLCVILMVLLVPVCAFSERIYGDTYRTGNGSTTYLRSSDGSSATINANRDGSFDIYTTPSTEQSIGDLNRAHDETRQSIERLDRQLNGDH